MIEYGAGPASDEIELTLFGPGYGEAVAVHLGEGAWLLVDSCIDPRSSAPASETYFDAIGVASKQVYALVASHWHDDHVRGISRLATKYANAEFFLSAVFNQKDAAAFLAAYGNQSSSGLGRGAKELFAVVQSRESVFYAMHRSIVLEMLLNGRQVRVTALSPLPATYKQFLAHIAPYLAKGEEPINHAPDARPNFQAIALHLDFGDDAILLGADLEEHRILGWSAVVADRWSGARRTSSAYKIAHHGSHTGHCGGIWASLLKPNPIVTLTPFTRGDLRLPTATDIARVKGNTDEAYITSGASRKPKMDSRLLKRLTDICRNLAPVDSGFGAIRLRKRVGSASWNVELFGTAAAL